MKAKLPKSLRKAPLLEVIFSVEYAYIAVEDIVLLPGMLYAYIGSDYPFVEKMDGTDLPVSKVYEHRASPLARLSWLRATTEAEDWAICVGATRLSLHHRTPYQGWRAFAQRAHQILEVLLNYFPPAQVSELRLRMLNFFPQSPLQLNENFFSQLLIGEAGSLVRLEATVEINASWIISPLSQRVRLIMPWKVQDMQGILMDIDTQVKQEESLPDLSEATEKLERLHEAARMSFFNLIHPEALKMLDPVYD